MRPVYHRKEDRIRAHVLLSFLALLLTRVAETRASDTWPNLRRELERIAPRLLPGLRGSSAATHGDDAAPARDPHRARRRRTPALPRDRAGRGGVGTTRSRTPSRKPSREAASRPLLAYVLSNSGPSSRSTRPPPSRSTARARTRSTTTGNGGPRAEWRGRAAGSRTGTACLADRSPIGPGPAQRAMQAMLGMGKLDIAALRSAPDGVPAT